MVHSDVILFTASAVKPLQPLDYIFHGFFFSPLLLYDIELTSQHRFSLRITSMNAAS